MRKVNSNLYDCVVCLDICRRPISCSRCHHLICSQHIRLLANRCPHCRLEPFQFQEEPIIQKLVQFQRKKQREQLKKSMVFKCLVEGCSFEGKYPTMIYHKKSKHSDEILDEILFPEERDKKKVRQILTKVLMIKQEQKAQFYKEQTLKTFVKCKATFSLGSILKMIIHIDDCADQNCKEIIMRQGSLIIGRKHGKQQKYSQCNEAKSLNLIKNQ